MNVGTVTAVPIFISAAVVMAPPQTSHLCRTASSLSSCLHQEIRQPGQLVAFRLVEVGSFVRGEQGQHDRLTHCGGQNLSGLLISSRFIFSHRFLRLMPSRLAVSWICQDWDSRARRM